MITLLTKRFSFSSAHRMFNTSFTEEQNLKEFGTCTNIHGHNYLLEVSVQGEVNQETGCILNLHNLKDIVEKEVVSKIDHKYLNDFLPDGKDRPVTLETLGQWIWKQLSEKISDAKLKKIKIWETPENSLEIYDQTV